MTKDEFAVAMHLIKSRMSGTPLPATLPPELVPPSMRIQALKSLNTGNGSLLGAENKLGSDGDLMGGLASPQPQPASRCKYSISY